MRILGIDYGDARVGIAVSDLLGFMAQGVRTIKNRGTEKLLTELKEILDEYKPEKIVIGLPKNMDGRVFVLTQRTNLPTHLKQYMTAKLYFGMKDFRLSVRQGF